MRRAAFGARPDEINNVYLKQGFEATVDQLVNYENVTEDPSLSLSPQDTSGVPYNLSYRVTSYTSPSTGVVTPVPDALTYDRLSGWWIDRMIKTKRPLQEMLTIFWHDHFATSFSKVSNTKYLYWQNDLVRQNASGNFRTMLKAINKDPAMIEWLDSQLNTKSSPNENYGRELMELFTLGFENYLQGAYTEADVQQAARAFTGWQHLSESADGNGFQGASTLASQLYNLPPATNTNVGVAKIHDYTNKTVFGVVNNFNGDDIVDLILDHEPQRTFAAKFIGKKLWEYFAYTDPEPYIVDHLATILKKNNFEFKPLLRDMFLNMKEFYSDKAIQSQIKQPVHFMVSSIRLLQASVNVGNLPGRTDGTVNTSNLKNMGQYLFSPPDVSGWVGGSDWISSSQFFSRANWANTFATNRSTTLAGNTGIPIDTVLATGGLTSTATADQVVDYFTSLLIQRPLATTVRQALIDYLKKADNGTIGTFSLTTDKGSATTNYKKVRGLIHLLLSRPEFNVW